MLYAIENRCTSQAVQVEIEMHGDVLFCVAALGILMRARNSDCMVTIAPFLGRCNVELMLSAMCSW